MHHRLEPEDHQFHYKIFMFYLDLDEIDEIVKKNPFISRNRFNLFNFRDRDHLQLSKETPSKNLKEEILQYVSQKGQDPNVIKHIKVVTNLRTLGYQFNPVSFYFCFDAYENPVCSIVEVGNTFGEIKPYFLGDETLEEGKFNSKSTKHFYVSPFIDMDTVFHFNLSIPGEKLKVNINDYQKDRRFFLTTLSGKRKTLNFFNVLFYFLRFPLITLQIIGLIHWQAIKLWLRGINYHKKNSSVDLQKDIFKPHKSIAQ